MEPVLPTPNITPNHGVPRPHNAENSPAAPLGGENAPGPDQRPEAQPAAPEVAGEQPLTSQADPAAAQQAAQAAQDFATSATQGAAAAMQQTAPVSDTPLLAEDDDLIEKEWVAKAKQIVALTRDDPHLQEREVSRLQADYMKRRFGKDLKLAA